MSYHRVQHRPSAASSQDRQSPAPSQFLIQLQVNQSIESQLPSRLPQNRPPPSTPPISLDHSQQVPLQTRSGTSSECISGFTRSRPWSVCPNSLDYGLQVHLWVHSISVSKCISNLARSWPPSASLSSPHLGLQVHLQTRSITASKHIVEERQWVYGDTWVTEVEWATRVIYLGDPRVDILHLIFISSCHTMKRHTVSFPTFGLTRPFRGSTQLCRFSWPGSIISSHLLPTLLELNVEGPQEEIFAASSIALQSQCKCVPNEPFPPYGHSWQQRQSVRLK